MPAGNRMKKKAKKYLRRIERKLGINRPMLSVIITLYNCEDYITECLKSVSQSLKDIKAEVIIVDDGSTDRSSAIAKRYVKNHNRFKYYRTENRGLAAARNYGISKAWGKYFGFVDADDVVNRHMYDRLLDAAEKNRADVAIIDAERFDSRGTWESILHRKVFDGMDRDVIHIRNYPKLVYDSTIWNKIIRRRMWINNDLSFPDGRIYEDVAVSIPLHYEANRVAAVREVGYRWRNRENTENKSISQKTDDPVNLEDRLFALRNLFDYANRRMMNETEIIREMKYKFLTIDIRMFVDKALILEGEKAKMFTMKIADFLKEYFTEEDFDLLDEKNREIYGKFLEQAEQINV